jgi:predicted anti-sigma-YlaC factor YlaD
MNCREIRRQIPAYMDSESDGSTSRLIEHHLAGCSACREYLHGLREADSRVRELPRLVMNPDFARRVVNEAMKTAAAGPDNVSFASRLRLAMLRLSEIIFGRFRSENGPDTRTSDTRTLDEFGDFPPLFMSSIYFKLIEHPVRG